MSEWMSVPTSPNGRGPNHDGSHDGSHDGAAATVDHNGIDCLDRDTCMALLRSVPVGRISVSCDALPVILPVNFAVGTNPQGADVLVVRADPGAKLTAALRRNIVAFEIDGFDMMNHAGWSVLVQGTSRIIDDPDEIGWASHLPLLPWAMADAHFFVAITIDVVSGRSFGDMPMHLHT